MKMTEVAVTCVQEEGVYSNGSLVSSTSSSSSTSSTSSCNCDTRMNNMENELRKVSAQSHTQKLWLEHLCNLLSDKLGIDVQIAKNIGSFSDGDVDNEVDIENDRKNQTNTSPASTEVSSSTTLGSLKNTISVPTQSSTTNNIIFPNVDNKVDMEHQPQQQQKQEPNLGKMKTVVVYQGKNDKRKFSDPCEMVTNKIEKKDSAVVIPMSTNLTTTGSTNAAAGSYSPPTPQLATKAIQPQPLLFNLNNSQLIRLPHRFPGIPGNKQVYMINSFPFKDASKFFTNSTLPKSPKDSHDSNENGNPTTSSNVTLDLPPMFLPAQAMSSSVPTVEVTINTNDTSSTATMHSGSAISTEFSAAEIPIKMEVEVDQEIICEDNNGNNSMNHQVSLGQFNEQNDTLDCGDENTDDMYGDSSMFEDEDEDDGIYPDYPIDDPDTVTTLAGNRVMIVHDNDPNIDIKYDPFGDLIPVEHESQDDVPDEPRNAAVDQRPPVALSLFELTVEALHLSNPSTSEFGFNWMWLLDMKKHQHGLMPYTMLIKRDDIRQWFEYRFDKDQPALSKYRCWICYKFIQLFGYPETIRGPMENGGGQLRLAIVDNRNSINSHGRKKCHREILQKLSLPENKRLYPIPDIVRFDDAAKKQLTNSLKTS